MSMESRAAWDAEYRKTLEAISTSLATLERKLAALLTRRSTSQYGADVDAVARRGAFLAALAEIARLEAKNAALKARLVAGYPQRTSVAPLPSYATEGL